MEQLFTWLRRLTLIAFAIEVIKRIVAAVINAINVYIKTLEENDATQPLHDADMDYGTT